MLESEVKHLSCHCWRADSSQRISASSVGGTIPQTSKRWVNRYNYSGEKSWVKTRKLHPAVKELEYPVLAADSKLSQSTCCSKTCEKYMKIFSTNYIYCLNDCIFFGWSAAPKTEEAIPSSGKYQSKLQGWQSIPFQMASFQKKLQLWELSDSSWSTRTWIKVHAQNCLWHCVCVHLYLFVLLLIFFFFSLSTGDHVDVILTLSFKHFTHQAN